MQATDLKDPRAWAGAIAVVFGFIVLSLPGVSWGADGTYTFSDFAIPNPTRGDTSRLLLTIDTSDHNGQTCTVVVDTINGESVHPENYVTLEGGVPTVTVTGTEDGAFGEHQNTTTVVLGDTLEVWNHFSLATSVDGDVTITCDTTTTTAPPPGSSSTTSTAPSTTTTTDGTTSTTPPAPTTTVPTDSTTTLPPVTTNPSTPDDTLPFTGPEDVMWGGIGLAALAVGALGLYATRSRHGKHEA